MADRSNARLNEAIEQHIAQWDGTVHGGIFIGMSNTDALKIDIYQIFNDI